jgi:hypothetical protein
MLEILTERFHDVDARNSVAGDIVFHTTALSQTLKINLYIEDGRGNDTRRKNAQIYISDLCVNAKTTTHAFTKLLSELSNPSVINKLSNSSVMSELAFEFSELIDTAYDIAEVKTLHELLIINLQRQHEIDNILEERYQYITSTPFMKLEFEQNSIHPLLYGWPMENFELCHLMRQADINPTELHLTLSHVVDKVFAYLTHLMDVELMTPQMIERMVLRVMKNNFPINIRDKRTLLYPFSRCMETVQFSTMWNIKYPYYGYLLAAAPSPSVSERCQSLREDVLSMRTPQGWDIEQILKDMAWKEEVKADIVKNFRKRPDKASTEMGGTPPPEQHHQLPQQPAARAWQPLLPMWLPAITKWHQHDTVQLLPSAPAATTTSAALRAAMTASLGAGDPHGVGDPHGAGDPDDGDGMADGEAYGDGQANMVLSPHPRLLKE